MKITTTLVAGVVLASSLAAQSESSGLEETLKKHAEALPLKKDARRSVYAVQVELNSKPLWMVVDSAAEALTFSLDAAKLAEIPLKPATVGPPNQAVQVMVGPVESLTLGNAKVASEAMPFMSYSRMGDLMIDGAAQTTGGQIGAGFLKSVHAVVDFSKNRLLLPTAPLDGGLSSVFETAKIPALKLVERNSRLLAPATLQGKDVYLLCSSGAARSSVNQRAVKEHSLKIDEGNEDKPTQAHVPDLKIGELVLKDAAIMVMGDGGDVVAGKPVIGVLGIDLLEASQAIISFGDGRLFFNEGAK
jgi:hypothetical protein